MGEETKTEATIIRHYDGHPSWHYVWVDFGGKRPPRDYVCDKGGGLVWHDERRYYPALGSDRKQIQVPAGGDLADTIAAVLATQGVKVTVREPKFRQCECVIVTRKGISDRCYIEDVLVGRKYGVRGRDWLGYWGGLYDESEIVALSESAQEVL